MPLDYEIIIQDRRARLESGVKCLVEFEGGMGDQLMEAAAVMTAMEVYPRCEFAIQANGQYVDILRRIPGIPRVESAYVGQARDHYQFTVSNHTKYISDPRGGMYGKASLYGAWLGLERVSKVSKIKLAPADYHTELVFLAQWDLTAVEHNFMIQFRSGSGHAKSWQYEKVIRLAELLRSTYDCNVFVVGKENELQRGLPHLVDLTGRSTWWQTCLLESNMSVVIGIDSGVMHLARSLGIPYVAMWGGTNAQCILGEEEGEFDIRLPLDCRDVVCFDCQRKTNACMDHITPAMVMEKVHLIIQGGRE
jgi:ADP-heptose:LPS heptosyltransferase